MTRSQLTRLTACQFQVKIGYGLPGKMTVWSLGGGDYHEGNAARVAARVLQHMDNFVELYVQAQWTCGA